MKPIPLIRKVVLAPAITYLASEGVPVDRYLQRAKLSAPTPETLDSLIPLQQLCDFLSSVAREQGLDDLGFRVAGNLGNECLGSFGRLIAKAFTLHEAIQISREFISTYNSGQLIWIERHGDQVRYCQNIVDNLRRDRVTEIVHAGLATALAAASGTGWRLTRIELPTDPIDLVAYVPEFDSIPVSFNQPHTSLWFDHAWLSKPLLASDGPQCPLADVNERASLVATCPAADPIEQLKQVIESMLGHPEMDLRVIAAILGTSSRTLQRHLAQHDASFSRLLEEARFRTAQRLLRDPQMPLTEIAKRLGYTDPANFIRAFKRWTGVGPNEYRRLHYGHGHK